MTEEETYYGPQRGNFYTLSRKVQELVGKLPDGTYIWGGPYTIPQILSGVVVSALALLTRQLGLWGGQGAAALIFDLLVVLVLGVATIYVVGKLPAPKRSILGIINGVVNIITAPDTGTWRGRGLPVQKPVKNKPVKDAPAEPAAPQKATAVTSSAEERRIQEFADEPPMCGLDLLLADSMMKGQ